MSGGVFGAIFGGMGGASGIHGVRKTDRSRRGTYVTMTTVSLTTVLDDAKAPRFIDYLSLDVEGNLIMSNHRHLAEMCHIFV